MEALAWSDSHPKSTFPCLTLACRGEDSALVPTCLLGGRTEGCWGFSHACNWGGIAVLSLPPGLLALHSHLSPAQAKTWKCIKSKGHFLQSNFPASWQPQQWPETSAHGTLLQGSKQEHVTFYSENPLFSQLEGKGHSPCGHWSFPRKKCPGQLLLHCCPSPKLCWDSCWGWAPQKEALSSPKVCLDLVLCVVPKQL